MQIVTSPSKEILYKFLFFTCFWSPRQQLSFGQHFGGGVVSSIGLSSGQIKPDMPLVKYVCFSLECL